MNEQSSLPFSTPKNAAGRIASSFFDLLERQFPVDRSERPLELKTAQDFAQKLFIHVNHLNRSLKEITGRPTSAHIAERIMLEANTLLQSTPWNTGEIAYALGFKYPSHFNNFYKKQAGMAPSTFRASLGQALVEAQASGE
jgi:AraC-like DNA-binding protein